MSGEQRDDDFEESLAKYMPGILEGWDQRKRVPPASRHLIDTLEQYPPLPWSTTEAEDRIYSLRSDVLASLHTSELDRAVFHFIDRFGGPANKTQLPLQQMAEWLAASDAWDSDQALLDALRDHPHEINLNFFAYLIRRGRRELAGITCAVIVQELEARSRMKWSARQTVDYLDLMVQGKAK